MRIPKRYGSYKVELCPFCGKNATVNNPQQIPVCSGHAKSILRDLSCLCGGFLELRDGKYGAYFNCMNCGNINIKKALEMNPGIKDADSVSNANDSKPKERKEITITSDQVDVYYSSEDD